MSNPVTDMLMGVIRSGLALVKEFMLSILLLAAIFGGLATVGGQINWGKNIYNNTERPMVEQR